MPYRKNAGHRALDLARCEDGAATGFGLVMMILLLMFAGLAIDAAQYNAARTQLQSAADSAAHAALVARVRDRMDEDEAKALALELVEANMPGRRFGQTVTANDIEFGRWDSDRPYGDRFVPSNSPSPSAARVVAWRDESRLNAVRTFLLRLVGVTEMAAATPAVFATYQPICLREGMVAEGKVDVQSNNLYLRGFCIHSNSYVSINQNNTFEEGTIVSMPDLDLLELPNSGYEQNDGLEAALREGELDVRILRQMDAIIDGLLAGDPRYLTQDYITTPGVAEQTLTRVNNDIAAADLEANRVNHLYCDRHNGSISIPSGELIEELVLVTNCDVNLSSGVTLEDVVLATTSTDSRSIDGASDVSIGRDDNCAEGGGTQVLTMGGMRFPANLGVFGGQLLAQGDINFAARADGIQGASMVAGGEIDGTSNSSMARCNQGMDGNFEAEYFRMAM